MPLQQFFPVAGNAGVGSCRKVSFAAGFFPYMLNADLTDDRQSAFTPLCGL
jgi:hypothetical protein